MIRLAIALAIGFAGSLAITVGAGHAATALDPCAAYYLANPDGYCQAPLITLLWAVAGVGTMGMLVGPIVLAIHPCGVAAWRRPRRKISES